MKLEQKLKHYRLNLSEYHKICELLKREPNNIEWALFSALWSEHCSYKSSKVHLRKFAQTIDQKVASAMGENAGIIDIGEGEKIAFKMESHNHPSFIEPFQGAATGVGGILRDIFTMGARPIALANYLCFGEIEADRMKDLVRGVVHGISSYGNCVGVPTLTGETQFQSAYDRNILVNALAVGYLGPQDPISLSAAKGVGNFVVYVGAKTGKDGVHGAAMASESFDANNDAKKPNIQIGDPYFEKLLIESCIEVIRENLVVAIQDMGAAGLTSSSFEMASKGQLGMNIQLDLVPTRDSSILPEEILLSESQERMLLICEPRQFLALQKHFAKWGLDAAQIGEVAAERRIRLTWHGEVLTEIDPDLLVENAPVYQREFHKWTSSIRQKDLVEKVSSMAWIQKINDLKNYKMAQKKYIYEQYDQRVGASTILSSDNAEIGLQKLPSGRALALSLGCRADLMKVDASLGASDAVIMPVLKMAAKGARALAVTDCLNFGSPEVPEIMSEFVASVDAIVEAAKVFATPVISGNVSFYNATEGKNIISTPATGLIGLRESVDNVPREIFTDAGNLVCLIQAPSLFFAKTSETPLNYEVRGALNLPELKSLQELLLRLNSKSLVRSIKSVGLSGWGVSSFKMLPRHLEIQWKSDSSETQWESLYQFVLEVSPKDLSKLKEEINGSSLVFQVLGELVPTVSDYFMANQIRRDEYSRSWEQGLSNILEGSN